MTRSMERRVCDGEEQENAGGWELLLRLGLCWRARGIGRIDEVQRPGNMGDWQSHRGDYAKAVEAALRRRVTMVREARANIARKALEVAYGLELDDRWAGQPVAGGLVADGQAETG